MRESVKDKVSQLIERGPETFNEYELIFMLSRIRKIIESDRTQKKYQNLWSYCNWALHNQIDRGAMLERLASAGAFKDNEITEEEIHLMAFNYLFSELRKFIIDELGIKDFEYKESARNNLEVLFNEIYRDTPLIISYRKRVTLVDPEHWRIENE